MWGARQMVCFSPKLWLLCYMCWAKLLIHLSDKLPVFQEGLKNLLSVKVNTVHCFLRISSWYEDFFLSFVINTTHVNSDNPEAVELSRSDIKCLNPGVYVSSPVINYYIQLRICIPIFKFYFMSFYDLLFLETAWACHRLSLICVQFSAIQTTEFWIIRGNRCRI
jgi:hypothetical protein